MNLLKKGFLGILSFTLCLIILFSGKISLAKEQQYADDIVENITTQLGIERVDAPIEVMELIREKGKEIVMDTLEDPEYLQISEISYNDIKIMEPYTGYIKQDSGMFKFNEIYYFPVVSDDKVLFTIDVFFTPEGYMYSVANEIGELLTTFVNEKECSRVYIDNGENYNKCEYEIVSVKSKSNLIERMADLQEESIITNENIKTMLALSDDIEVTTFSTNKNSKISYDTQGFSINESTYKRLNMTNCLVSQASYKCAIPCIATIYRYRTATHTMTSASLTALNDSLYGFDVTKTEDQVKLINTIMPTSPQDNYEVNWTKVNQLLVKHNINNKFPILLGGSSTQLSSAHAFVIEGYRMSGNNMKWFVYNPWGHGVETPYYANGATYYFSSGGYQWYQSGGSCLLIP